MCVCVCVCVCIYICVYECVFYVLAYLCVCVCVCECVCLRAFVCPFVSARMYMLMCSPVCLAGRDMYIIDHGKVEVRDFYSHLSGNRLHPFDTNLSNNCSYPNTVQGIAGTLGEGFKEDTVVNSRPALNLATAVWVGMLLFVACLTSQQHASVSQGRICSDMCTCCHTETEVAHDTFHLSILTSGQPVPALTLLRQAPGVPFFKSLV